MVRRRFDPFLLVGLCSVFGTPTLCPAQRAGEAERRAPPIERQVTLYTPPVWFEGYASAALIAPDGSRAINFSGGIKVVDLRTGQEVRDAIWQGLDRVESATFGPQGELQLWGRLGFQAGLFRQGANGPVRVPLPPGAFNPRWSKDGTRLAFIRPGMRDSALMAGELEHLQAYRVEGRPVSLTWLPTNDAILIATVDSLAMASLVRVDLKTGQTQRVAKDLDAGGFRPLSISVGADGRHAYMALASAGAPAVAIRHRAHAPRGLGIYAIDLATGGRRVVVPAARRGDLLAPTVAAGQLFWTHTETDASVVVLPVNGGSVRTVIPDAQAPSWRPDGRQIGVFYGDWRVADWAINWDAGAVNVDTAGRATGPLLPLITGYDEDFPPIWSPDGRWIAYHSHRSAVPLPYYGALGSSDDIWLRRAPATSRDTTEIRLTDFGWEVGSPDWSRDGTRLLFTSWERGRPGVGWPWIVTLDPASGRALGHARLPLPSEIRGVRWAAWSPVADEIALEEDQGSGRHALWILASNGSAARKLTEYSMLTYGGVCWTPDGKTIIYAARVGERMQLFSIPATGGNPRQLTHDPAHLLHPRVSPNGKLIAATRLEHRREVVHRPLR